MDIKKLSPEVRQIWKVAKVVQGVMGFTMGLFIFTNGPLFYEKLTQASNPKLGMMLTTFLYGLLYGLMALLEVPTGAIGDAIGRKWTIVWSFFCRMLFFIFLAFIPFSNSVTLIMILATLAHIAFGFAYTFYSGTFTAWCVDSLREKGPDIGYEHLLSRAYTYNFVAQIGGGICGVLLYLWHVNYVSSLFGAVISAFCIAFCLGEMEEVKSLEFLERKRVSLAVITRRIGEILGVGFQVFRRSSVILSLTLVFASYMFVVNIVDYLWPVYLRTRIPVTIQAYYWIGLVVATQLVSAVGSHALTLWTHRWHKNNQAKTHNVLLRRWLIGACLFSSLPVLVLSWLTSRGMDTFWYFISAVLPVEFAYGVIAPCYETLVNNYIPDSHSQERATILSFGSLIRSLLVMFLAIPAGGSSGEKTTVGWAIPAFLLLAMVIIGNTVLKRAQRKIPEVVEVKVTPQENPLDEK